MYTLKFDCLYRRGYSYSCQSNKPFLFVAYRGETGLKVKASACQLGQGNHAPCTFSGKPSEHEGMRHPHSLRRQELCDFSMKNQRHVTCGMAVS